MSGPAPPRHVEGPRATLHARVTHAQESGAVNFPSLLSDDADRTVDVNSADPFEAHGMLGRKARIEETNAPREPSALVPHELGDVQPPDQTAAHAEPGVSDIAPATARTFAPAPARPGARAGGVLIPARQQAHTLAQPAAALVAQRQRPVAGRPALSPQPPTPRRANYRTRFNAVFVAIHALEQSCAVYARAGRMSATEREILRNSIRALLAEHGLTSEAILIDGVHPSSEPRGARWQR